MNKIPAIICAGQNGRCVVFGRVDRLPEPDEKITIYDARMILRWGEECGGLFGFAAQGPKSDTRLTHAIEQTTCTARQALSVSAEAATKIEDWPAYK